MRFPDAGRKHAMCHARLTKRRKVVARTLGYLAAERARIDANRRWISSSVERRRKALLDEVHGWYHGELKRINVILARLKRSMEPLSNETKDRLTAD